VLEPATPDLVYLSIGTGVAAGLVLGGRVRRGVRGAAGEIGHVPLDPAGPLCACGQHGCLEVLASGAAISRRWPSADGVSPARSLFDAADHGDPAAIIVRDEVAGHLASAVRMLVLTLDVEVVVLGGGVAELGPRLRRAVAAALERDSGRSPFVRALGLPTRVALVPGSRPVGALGAALAGQQAFSLAAPQVTSGGPAPSLAAGA
jgi:glucokinase